MADVITLSSSEDECSRASPSPPRKRIKPTPVPVLANLPQLSITKISVPPKTKKDNVVVVCSDEEDDEVTYIDAKDIVEIEDNVSKDVSKDLETDSHFQKVINNNTQEDSKDKMNSPKNVMKTENEKEEVNKDVLEISDEKTKESKSNSSSSINSDTEVKDAIEVVDDDIDHAELIKDLVDSCEIINEDSCEESSGKENRIESACKDAFQPCSSSISAKPSNTVLLGDLIKIYENQEQMNEKYDIIKQKIPALWKYYNKCENDLMESISFSNMLLTNIKKAKESAALSVISFRDIYQYLKETANTDCIEVEKDQVGTLKKLEKTMKRLIAMIKNLEEAELDFDEEEDSSYLKLERYISRLDKIYQKYCKILKKNPYSGRLTYSKLDFVDSEFNEINRAINKKYKNNKKFPSYYELEQFIRKVVNENKISLSESKIKSESLHCFQKLGDLLQNRRRKELYDVHLSSIKDTEDPAKKDSNLSETLKTNYLEGQSKLEKMVQEFVNKENAKGDGSESDSSEHESDKSNYVDSEDQEDNV